MYYAGFSYLETQHMPVAYRRWFVERIVKEINRSADDGNTQSRAAHMNTPDIRQLQGKTRDTVPARLRRFT